MSEINEFQRWPSNKKLYDENYERIFGKVCSICDGKKYLVDKSPHGEDIKTICIVCNGKGRV